MNVEIITIGDELLIGQVLDTNSTWMGRLLNREGFTVSKKISISDSKQDIVETLTDSLKRVDIVLITGGLGPTKDDITKKTLNDFFKSELIFNQDVFNNVNEFLKNRNNSINRLNREQAMVPKNCKVLTNRVGTAPIMWFEQDNKVIVSMPGVPKEMMFSMENDIVPLLKKQFLTDEIIHKTVNTNAIAEAPLAELISTWEDNLPNEITLAYLPSPGKVRLRLSLKGHNREHLTNLLNKELYKLELIIGEYIWGYDDELPQILIGKSLIKKNETLSCAESCTGGNIAHLITSIPGSSSYFLGGVVAYDNDIKNRVLNVNLESLKEYGAVSRQVVEEMALGVKKLMKTTWAVATSGIAGPGGGSKEKPVGTVWVAWAGPDGVDSMCYNFGIEREDNITRATEYSLVKLLKKINN